MTRLTHLMLIVCAMAALPALASAQPKFEELMGAKVTDWIVPKTGDETNGATANMIFNVNPGVSDQLDLGGFCATPNGTCQTAPGPNQSICFCGSDGGKIFQKELFGR